MRSIVVFVSVFALLAQISLAQAQMGLLDRLKILTDAANALGAAGDAIGKIANGMTVAAQRSTQGVDAIVTRLDRNDMRDLLARTSLLSGASNRAVINALETYVADRRAGRFANWTDTQTQISDVLTAVNALLTDVKAIRSDFVNEPAYETLLATLSGRQSVLMQLSSLPAPTTEDELGALDTITAKYRILQAELGRLNRAIADYNRAIAKPAPAPSPAPSPTQATK